MSNIQNKVGVIIEVGGEQYSMGVTLDPMKPALNRHYVSMLTSAATREIINRLLDWDLVERMPTDPL